MQAGRCYLGQVNDVGSSWQGLLRGIIANVGPKVKDTVGNAVVARTRREGRLPGGRTQEMTMGGEDPGQGQLLGHGGFFLSGAVDHRCFIRQVPSLKRGEFSSSG